MISNLTNHVVAVLIPANHVTVFTSQPNAHLVAAAWELWRVALSVHEHGHGDWTTILELQVLASFIRHDPAVK